MRTLALVLSAIAYRRGRRRQATWAVVLLAIAAMLSACERAPVTAMPPTSSAYSEMANADHSITLRGRLVDDAGVPIVGAAVSIAKLMTPDPHGAPDGREPSTPAPLARARSNRSGAYSLRVPQGAYVLTALPADAGATVAPPPSPYPSSDPAHFFRGRFVKAHATLHVAVRVTANGQSRTDILLRLTDNELVCAQIFNSKRLQARLPAASVDSALLATAHRSTVDEVKHWPNLHEQQYGGIGRTNPPAWDVFISATPCAGAALAGFEQSPLGRARAAIFFAASILNDARHTGPYSAGQFAIYP
jgi:hypothetical protein